MIMMKELKYIALGIVFICIFCNLEAQIPQKSDSNLVKRADFFYLNNNFENAKKCFDSLIKLYPVKGEYYFKRAYSKSMLIPKDINGSLSDYLKSIKLNYRQKSAYLNIGVILSLEGDCTNAVKYFDKCLKIEPTNKNASELRKKCLSLLNERNKKSIKNS